MDETTVGADSKARADAVILGRLRGLRAPWPGNDGDGLAEAVVERAAFHRVHALLHHRGACGGAWPDSVRSRLATLTRIEIAGEMIRSHELSRVLASFRERGIDALLFKGAALAHQRYAFPALRPRDDSDVLVRRRDRAAAEARLRDLGYARAPRIRGELIEHQAPYVLDDRFGCRHVIDLHWRLWNRPLLADLPFDDLFARSTPIASIGSDARGLGAVDAMLVACVHGYAHHAGQDRPLIWTWDVARLADSFSPAQWNDLCGEAERSGLRRLCLAGLRDARRLFGAALPSRVVASLAHGPSEPSARLLSADPRDMALLDLRAQKGLGRKLRFLREAVLPNPDYMRERYGVRGAAQLPMVYLKRAFSEVRRRTSSK